AEYHIARKSLRRHRHWIIRCKLSPPNTSNLLASGRSADPLFLFRSVWHSCTAAGARFFYLCKDVRPRWRHMCLLDVKREREKWCVWHTKGNWGQQLGGDTDVSTLVRDGPRWIEMDRDGYNSDSMYSSGPGVDGCGVWGC